MNTSPIAQELVAFLSLTGISAQRLSEESGVHAADISRLKNGRFKDIRSAKADALREAMNKISADLSDRKAEP